MLFLETAGFLRRFSDSMRVRRLENRVPKIREIVSLPAGPYWVPNIFLTKKLETVKSSCPWQSQVWAS